MFIWGRRRVWYRWILRNKTGCTSSLHFGIPIGICWHIWWKLRIFRFDTTAAAAAATTRLRQFWKAELERRQLENSFAPETLVINIIIKTNCFQENCQKIKLEIVVSSFILLSIFDWKSSSSCPVTFDWFCSKKCTEIPVTLTGTSSNLFCYEISKNPLFQCIFTECVFRVF